MRRKKLINNLTDWPREDVLRAIRDAGLDEGIRAEQMTLADFEPMVRRVMQHPRRSIYMRD